MSKTTPVTTPDKTNLLPGQADHFGDYDNIPGDLDNGLIFTFFKFLLLRKL